ncbi:MAG: class I SAM-dependent methyltransferase [bacterium]
MKKPAALQCDMIDASRDTFDRHAAEYDLWFDRHVFAYESELAAIRSLVPSLGSGIEIGAGTGRFCVPLNIEIALEPSARMAAIARSRGARVIQSVAEHIPFSEQTFDFAVLINVLCFVVDPLTVLHEARRILMPNGHVVVAIIDKMSPLGCAYEARKHVSRFYQHARFYSTTEVTEFLEQGGFEVCHCCQTIFSAPEDMSKPDPVLDGHGTGAFVVISAVKVG